MDGVPFYEHDLGQAELDELAKVLAGPILTTGETVQRFEQRFGDYLAIDHVVGLSSCTGALHLALTALEIGPEDEVITTPMTFVATATAIMQAGATPVFVDVEPTTGNIDASRIEAAVTERTRAIMPVHLYGQMCDMPAIRGIADRHGLVVIEDAAHAVEASRGGVRPGELADAVCFSFYATKSLTSGEGGALATGDAGLARRIRLLRLHGMSEGGFDRARDGYRHWDVVALGWKYNMDNIQAALLLPQLDRLGPNHDRRCELAGLYDAMLSDAPGLALPDVYPNSRHARHLYTVWIDGGRRDELIEALKQVGIGATVNYRAIHLLSYLRSRFGFAPGRFPNAERIGDATISLPLYPRLSNEQCEHVAGTMRRLCYTAHSRADASPRIISSR